MFVLGKPAHRSPVIAAAMDHLVRRGVPVRSVVPHAVASHARSVSDAQVVPETAPRATDDGVWAVDGHLRPVAADLQGARLIAQRGLARPVLARLGPWAQRCCNDPAATARTHHRVELLQTLAGAGVPVPQMSVLDDYRAARRRAARGSAQVIKALDARAGRGTGVLLPGAVPPQAPFGGPHLLQEHLVGWEAKMYLFGTQVRAAWRPAGQHRAGQPHQPSAALIEVATAAARAAELELCGVDLIVTGAGPVVIDVNAFPSAAKVPRAADLIAAHLAARWARAG